jgi:hypothetical protein
VGDVGVRNVSGNCDRYASISDKWSVYRGCLFGKRRGTGKGSPVNVPGQRRLKLHRLSDVVVQLYNSDNAVLNSMHGQRV